MAKQVNKRVVGGLTLTLMLMIIAGAVLFIPSLRHGDPTFHVARAEALVKHGQLEEAATAYLQGFQLDDNKDPINLVRAARCLWKTGDLESARRFCEMARTRGNTREALGLAFEMAFELAMV